MRPSMRWFMYSRPFLVPLYPQRNVQINRYGNEKVWNIKLPKAYNLYKVQEGPKTIAPLKKAEALQYYMQMDTIRRLEAVTGIMYKDKVIRGFCHLYTGQEACAVGIKSAMHKRDNVITSYRCHGWAYLMGVSLLAILAELAGCACGCSKGKGGSMHMYAPHFYGGHGIAGSNVPLGSGVALASQYKGDGAVTFVLYGEDAANQGQIFESFNMACLWKLPVIFVCENNIHPFQTKRSRLLTCNKKYFMRGDRIPGIRVDGTNVLAVHNATTFAKDYVLKNGPILLELVTHRYIDFKRHRSKKLRMHKELLKLRYKVDPIAIFVRLCLIKGILTQNELKVIHRRVHNTVRLTVRRAIRDKYMDLKALTSDVYARNLHPRIRGIYEHSLMHHQIRMGMNQ